MGTRLLRIIDLNEPNEDYGVRYMRSNQWIRAIDWFTRAIQRYPRPVHYFIRAEAYLALRRYGKAINDVQRGLILDPQSAQGWKMLVMVCSKMQHKRKLMWACLGGLGCRDAGYDRFFKSHLNRDLLANDLYQLNHPSMPSVSKPIALEMVLMQWNRCQDFKLNERLCTLRRNNKQLRLQQDEPSEFYAMVEEQKVAALINERDNLVLQNKTLQREQEATRAELQSLRLEQKKWSQGLCYTCRTMPQRNHELPGALTSSPSIPRNMTEETLSLEVRLVLLEKPHHHCLRWTLITSMPF
eukprot:Protomagalhaensia_wolfi_Nauph_80__960@NODE_1555_length_1472_cov_14_939986_g1208_i0_p1_GENE_NODE_1555_length_1472_cov_14_939986_g1208_i0NODE_1555_length_1472_cov_14_939986_g1208_i0_p1_ORF_typecomplete_len298_score9_55ANAPC3/PF12895_7/0_00039ANAPC3/PF12895_7/4_1e06TPR_16/PF13432_6/5_5e05TPR_16/PF13432_6/0_0018TPR_2/PF07719_17/0_06TPR_2/PF07719_17/0_0052TPR_15/PF13429_6/1_4e06TPR_14/PF13428_6/8_2TPR_14/PF13428_6/0_0076TPR_19/PF14559_6/8_7e05TPR_9/PF13371_6/0_00023TPR_9/PF13371_6/7_8e03TPR_1/PF00515